MSLATGYEWDLFVSYRGTDNVKGWVRNHFVPLLTAYLADEISREPMIFLDKNRIDTGNHWPDPTRSGLVLTDGVLAVRDLRDLQVDEGQLAYLSACSTAVGGWNVLDEAVHVSSAFQLVGYRHVVATMWPVGDLAARRLARYTYDGLATGLDPARAVRQAVKLTRALLPERPSVWAAHVHAGP